MNIVLAGCKEHMLRMARHVVYVDEGGGLDHLVSKFEKILSNFYAAVYKFG